MKALIIDDERLARVELRKLLAPHANVVVVGEADCADSAFEQISNLQPDLLFLDIEMPGKTGFDLLQQLDATPEVIFTTAYDAYALRAFDVSALDYLVKPIRPERLAMALERASRALIGRSSADASRRIFVKDRDRCWFISLSDVTVFESVGNYTRLYFGAENALVLRSLNYLEKRLPAQQFFRSSRKYIVNTDHIESIDSWLSGSLRIKTRGGHTVKMSRRQAQRFRRLMSL